MISKTKLQEYAKIIESYGVDNAAEMIGVTVDSIKRYIRLYKSTEAKGIVSALKKEKLRVLVLDIETSPSAAFVWKFWKVNVSENQVINDWYMLSWAAKWLNSSEIYSDVVTGEESKANDDMRIALSLHKMLQEADVVIAHNGRRFDIPKINTTFVLNGISKPSPFRIIDTLDVARKNFGFNRNSLNSLCKQFGIQGKSDTDMELWSRCFYGDEEALHEMEMYNRNDVIILEELYNAIKGWIPSHPRMYEDTDGMVCEVCGSEVLYLNGTYRTSVNSFDSYTCEHCGASLRKRNNKSDELVVCAR